MVSLFIAIGLTVTGIAVGVYGSVQMIRRQLAEEEQTDAKFRLSD